MIIANVIK